MYGKLFDQKVNLDEKNNRAFIESTERGFFPLCSSQVGLFHHVVMTLLKDLDPGSEHFDYEYNQVVFGGMLIELAMETDKYFACDKKELYPLTVGKLMRLCGIEKMPHPIIFWAPEDLIKNVNCLNLVKGVGQRILDGSLEFSKQHLDYHFQKSSEYLKNHHPGGCKNKDVHQEQINVLKELLEERHTQFVPSLLKCSP